MVLSYLLFLNTPSQVGLKMSSIASLPIKLSNCFLCSLFVNISVTCSVVVMYDMQIDLLSSFSLMKCLSTSICFVLPWRTGFYDIKMAALLSQQTFIGDGLEIFNSSSILFIHITSQIPWATDLNSASALLLATTFCFLLHQVTRFPPTKVQ